LIYERFLKGIEKKRVVFGWFFRGYYVVNKCIFVVLSWSYFGVKNFAFSKTLFLAGPIYLLDDRRFKEHTLPLWDSGVGIGQIAADAFIGYLSRRSHEASASALP
jgi:hypothetical protein